MAASSQTFISSLGGKTYLRCEEECCSCIGYTKAESAASYACAVCNHLPVQHRSAPVSLPFTPVEKYQGFISYAGGETEHIKGFFAEPLHSTLLRSGFRFFLDIELDISIPHTKMLLALLSSQIGIIFFTKSFLQGIKANSKRHIPRPWCLLELVQDTIQLLN